MNATAIKVGEFYAKGYRSLDQYNPEGASRVEVLEVGPIIQTFGKRLVGVRVKKFTTFNGQEIFHEEVILPREILRTWAEHQEVIEAAKARRIIDNEAHRIADERGAKLIAELRKAGIRATRVSVRCDETAVIDLPWAVAEQLMARLATSEAPKAAAGDRP